MYDKVIEACALTDDLKLFEGGDMTEIGEKVGSCLNFVFLLFTVPYVFTGITLATDFCFRIIDEHKVFTIHESNKQRLCDFLCSTPLGYHILLDVLSFMCLNVC
jgi:hypothetical protein